jgi:hypothetical protein
VPEQATLELAQAEAAQALLPERSELAAELVAPVLPCFPARSKGAQLLAQRIRVARRRTPELRQAEQVQIEAVRAPGLRPAQRVQAAVAVPRQ